jgi:hypothetical protein
MRRERQRGLSEVNEGKKKVKFAALLLKSLRDMNEEKKGQS